ncbi:MAG: C69 family dipeptidase [Pikeienuella sp.]
MSYALYIGKNHSATGHAWLGGYGDEPSSHWLEIMPRRRHEPGEMITVGVTPEAAMPGLLSEIPQSAETHRHIRVSYSHYLGVPAPLTNGGLNEHGVAVRDVWSTSRDELIAMTPKDQTGPNYSDLARIVIERATSAREGVELIGALIAQHGYSTYGGNSHLIADAGEAWVVIECAGGLGLWAAERLGPDSIRASRPGYIGVIDFDSDDFLHPSHLTDEAEKQGWWSPGQPFDFTAIYGDGKDRWDGVAWIEAEMAARAASPEKISLADMFWAVRTDRLTGDTAGYGQVVPLTTPKHPATRMLWHTQIGAIAAPFSPVFLGAGAVPEEYGAHRYLTEGEAARVSDTRHEIAGREDSTSLIPQGIESTRSASAVFKRLLYLILQNPDLFLADTTELWEALEAKSAPVATDTARVAELLLNAGEVDLAARHLTAATGAGLQEALELAETLAKAYEARTRILRGISDHSVPKSQDQIW